MAKRGWKRPFEDPIPLPRARQLTTLKDAAEYIQKLPEAEQLLEEWQAAVEALLLVVNLQWADHDGAHRHDEGAQSPRRARVQSGSQRERGNHDQICGGH